MRKLSKSPLFLLTMAGLLVLAILQAALPDRARSDMENRPLAQLSAPTLSGITSGRWMKDAETYVADQFPGRDGWMAVQAVWDAAMLRTERNGILIGSDGWMFEKTANLLLRTARSSVQTLNALAEQLDVPVSLMLVPMSSAVYEEQMPRWYEADDQEQVLRSLYAEASSLETIDVLQPLLAAKTQRDVFYRTDHHWTAQGAEAGYEALLSAWGMTPAASDGIMVDESGFYGTYFARAPSPLIAGDTLTFDIPDGVVLAVGDEDKDGLYDPTQMAARDKYASLLWGNHGRMTLTSSATGGTLLVIKDSYANALLPLLSRHFGRIEAVDLRYFSGNLPALIEEVEAERILCLYGLTTWLTDRNLLVHGADWDG